jgi:gliding motility-associated-like protein
MNWKKHILLLLLICAPILGNTAVIIVTNGNNAASGSLRQAINDAVGGDSIIVNYKGAIALTSPIQIANKNNITIIGPYPKHIAFTAEGGGTPNIFEIDNSTNITFKGFAFKHFFDPTFNVRGAFIENNSSVSFVDCLFEGCQPEGVSGGAISVHDDSKISLLNCSFFNNKASVNGGAVYFNNANNNATIRNCTFHNNTADSLGGAIYIDTVYNVIESFIFYNNTFLRNTADTTNTDAGHAVWFNVAYNALGGSRAVVFINNIIAENFNDAYRDQSQVYAPNSFGLLNNNIWASYNYYQYGNSSESIVTNFTATPSNDYTGEYTMTNLNLRSQPVTDGYGLKYFTIQNGGSPLVNSGDNTPSYTVVVNVSFSSVLATTDQRRAPRIIQGTVDIGAAEYTPFRVTSTGVNQWRQNIVAEVNTNGSSTTINYIEFDLPALAEVPVQNTTTSFNRSVYIDGFSQDGSAIPGPSNTTSMTFMYTSDSLTPARNLVTLYPVGNPVNGIELNTAPNSIVAGLSIVDFDEFGILINASATGTRLFGNVIGVKSNVAAGLAVSTEDGNGWGGVLVNAENVVIGGAFHHLRNVIVDNGFNAPDGAPDYFGANIHKGSSANTFYVYGNVIGLHPNGKDSIPIHLPDITKRPSGLYIDSGTDVSIGKSYLFSKNIISNHKGDGIFHKNFASGNVTVDNNFIGTSFDGNIAYGNKNGIKLKDGLGTTGYSIGSISGNIISASDSAGIRLLNTGNVRILGNIIGSDSALTSNAFGNEIGIYATGTSGSVATPILIGNDGYQVTNQRNIITNNNIGVYLSGPNVEQVSIQGNLIGVVDSAASSGFGNQVGIKIDSSAHHTYIGYNPASGLQQQINIISGNSDAGIWIDGSTTNNNIIASNIVGGTLPTSAGNPLQSIGNGTGVKYTNVNSNQSNRIGNENDPDLKLVVVGNTIGVEIIASSSVPVFNSNVGIDANDFMVPNETGIYTYLSDTIIIGGLNEKSNRISGNDSVGINIEEGKRAIIDGNYIGLASDGLTARPNDIGIKIRKGQFHEIGQAQKNIISGNRVGLLMDSTESNTIRNNYFGISAIGSNKIGGSQYGIVGRNLSAANSIGTTANLADGRNYFETDSVDIYLNTCKDQYIVNNVFGYKTNNIDTLGAPQTGIGVALTDSKNIRIGSPLTWGTNILVNKRVGVLLLNTDSSQIQHTHLGTNIAGSDVSHSGNQRYGILSRGIGGSTDNLIGPNNIYGGNRVGLILANLDVNNKIWRNFFGTDSLLNTTTDFRNDTAMFFSNADNNLVGFEGDSANQMINYIQGIVLRNTANDNLFRNNYIGILSDGTTGTNTGNGVVIDNSFGNKFGGVDLSEINTISDNDGVGVSIVNGSSGNALLRNNIYANGGLGIDIGGNGTFDNTGFPGVQETMETPIINAAYPCLSDTDLKVEVLTNGLLVSEKYYVDIYNSGGFIDPSSYGEGRTSVYFDSITATATSETTIFDLSSLGLTTADTLVAILTKVSTGSSSEFGMYASVETAPDTGLVTVNTEICINALGGGSILFDNSINSGYNYTVLFNGLSMTSLSPHNFAEDSLVVGNYTIAVEYGAGCLQNFDTILTAGTNTFDIDTLVFADTCELNTGQIDLTVINNSIIGTIDSTTYSFNSGLSYGLSNFVGGLGNGDSRSVTALLHVNGEQCPASDTISVTIQPYSIPVANLNFSYDNFCSDSPGSVTTPPIFTNGQYAQVGGTGIGTLSTLTGDLAGVSDNEIYKIIYFFGNNNACESDTTTVEVFDVPDPTVSMADFCANGTSELPVISSPLPSDIFSLLSKPVGAIDTINPANGELGTAASEFTPGNYTLQYATNDPDCPRTDTDVFEVFAKPAVSSLTAFGNTFDTNGSDIDSITYCPTIPVSSNIISSITNTTWIDPFGVTTTNSFYAVNLGLDDSVFVLDYFNTFTNVGGIQCSSDLDSILVEVYKTPVAPNIINGNVAYCEGQLPIAVLENNASTSHVNWFLNATSNQTVVDNDFYPFSSSYNNAGNLIFAQDSTGFACYSEFDTTEVIFLKRPLNTTITYLGQPLVNNDTITPCPTYNDTIFGNPPSILENIIWDTIGGTVTNNIFIPNVHFMPGTNNTIYTYKDSTYQTGFTLGGPTVFTCESFRDTIQINILETPVQPNMVLDSVSYCFGEVVDTITLLNAANTVNVLWYDSTKLDMSNLNTPSDSHYVAPVYIDQSFYVFARDSSGENCYSQYDSIKMTFYQPVDLPTLKINLASNDTVFPLETITLCPVSFDSVMSSTSDEHTIWQLNALAADTAKYFSPPFPAGTSTLRYYADTLHLSTMTFCRSDIDSIFLEVLPTPLTSNLANTAYCDNENITALSRTGLFVIWNNISTSAVTTTSGPHTYLPATIAYDNHIDTILVIDSTGVTNLGQECKSAVDSVLIAYHARPDTSVVSLLSSGAAPFDTTFICPGVSESFTANTPSAATFWYTANSLPVQNNVFSINGFVSNSDSIIFNYRDTMYTTIVPKTCYSDTNSRVVHTFEAPVPIALTTGDTAYCEGEQIDSLIATNGTNIVWTETGNTATSTVSPHKFLQTTPITYDNSIDSIIYRNVTGTNNFGAECTSPEDTIFIAYHAKPDTTSLTQFTTGLPAADTTFICPSPTLLDSLNATIEASSTYYWSTNLAGTYNANTGFSIAGFTPNSLTTVYHYRDSLATFTIPKACPSDTILRYVQTYKVPVTPIISTDSSYCEGQEVDTLTLVNDALVTSIKWGDLSTIVTDSLTSSPFEYGVSNIIYDGSTKTIFAIDYTGEGCFSDTGKVFLSFHAQPSMPLITENGNLPNLAFGDPIFVCPTDNTNFLESNTNETNWYGNNTVISNNDYNIISQLPLTADSVKSVAFINYSGVQSITCYSDTMLVVVNTYNTPITPNITSGGVQADTVLYCADDLVNDLGITAAGGVNWFQVGVPGSQLINATTYAITEPSPFNGQSFTYIAYDSTGAGCFSDNDSIVLEFQPKPNPPILSIASNSYCENEQVDAIFANDIFSVAVVSDWFVNDSTTTPVLTGADNYLPNYNFAADSTITYYAQTESAEGCKSYFSQVGVSFHPTPILPAINIVGSGLEYCPEDGLDTLFSDSILTWYYVSNTALNIMNDTFDLNDIPLAPNTQDVINYFYTDHFSCNSDSGSVNVEVFPIPVVPVISTGNTAYCLGDAIDQFTALDGNGNALVGNGTWYDINGNVLLTGAFNYGFAPQLSVGDTAAVFNYTDANGCLSENDTITITTFPTPATPSITWLDTVYCEGEPILPLSEANNINTNWYFILNGNPDLQLANSSTYTPTDSGTYTAITIENNCESLPDSIEIVINQLPATPVIQDMQLSYCSDELIDTIRIENNSNGFWYESPDFTSPLISGSDFYVGPNAFTDSITYYVSVLDPISDCRSNFDSITLYQFLTVGRITTEMAEICEGYTQELTAEGGVTYLWSTNDTTANTFVSPKISTWYFVDIIDENNCKVTDSIEVFLKLPASCEETVYTAFSPNGDGVNETWEITGIEIYANPVVYIFNRWGDRIAVIENYNNATNAWDGMNYVTNTPVVYGTYYYIIEDGGTRVKDGWLQVVK